MHDCWWGFAGKPEPGEQRQLKRLSKHRDVVEATATGPGNSTLAATPAPANAGKIQRQAWAFLSLASAYTCPGAVQLEFHALLSLY